MSKGVLFKCLSIQFYLVLCCVLLPCVRAEEFLLQTEGKYLGWARGKDEFQPCTGKVMRIGKGKIEKTSERCPRDPNIPTISVSYSSLTANQSPLWIAQDTGIFGKYHLNANVVLIQSGATSIRALLAGETQIAQLPGGVVLSSGLAGADAVFIAGLENRLAYSLVAQREIKSADQLKGKRLAISGVGSASDLGARLILQQLGLISERDVTFVQVGGTSTRLTAITQGSVAATVITPEFYILAKKAGFTTLTDPLFMNISFPQNAIATRRTYLRSQPEIITQYLRAIIEAIHYFKNNRDESMRIMAKYLKIQDREALTEIYELYKNVFAPLPVPTVEGMQTLIRWMPQTDFRAREVRADQFIDSTALREIEKTGFVSKLYQR